ncbi:unnamed protein product [Amoebophrya sp. A120]|nr:unnamed protein product [Amoebophrya sp. A120]|eukprot:GSA120T00011665001.1
MRNCIQQHHFLWFVFKKSFDFCTFTTRKRKPTYYRHYFSRFCLLFPPRSSTSHSLQSFCRF